MEATVSMLRGRSDGRSPGQREASVERPRQGSQRARRGIGNALLDPTHDALMQAGCRRDLFLGQMQLPAAVDDLLDQIETVPKRIEMRPAGSALGLCFVSDLLKKILEVRHATIPSQW